MIKIGICDDEKIILNSIKNKIENEFNCLNVSSKISLFTECDSLLACENINDFDILFLDVELDSQNGIQLAEKIRKRGYYNTIVFITSFADYSRLGYKVNAFRFILKQNLKDELSECIKNLTYKLGLKKFKFSNFDINEREIVYIESNKHKVIIHLKNGEKYEEYEKLDRLQEILNSDIMIRVHQSYLVNFEYIKDIKCYILTLKNNIEIPIPKVRYGDVRRKIMMKKMVWR